MNVAYGVVRLLPEFQFRRCFQLSKSGVKMRLQAFRRIDIDRIRLVSVFADVRKMSSQQLAQTMELFLSLIAQTKVEGLKSSLLREL